eukprot:TRINITY_DN68312_c0_g1_i1.p1 TRINITY_DN68312_c0_g1~~TRINITY_DN68312_c0_g1_i1.p1  ORF type:complete len:237 (+),score=39.57 TRINITY_DN68312_c0_g1_i1:95-712(+)
MSDAQKDGWIADYLVEGYESDGSRTYYGYVLSGLQKVFPRLSLKLSWKVYDVWGLRQPVRPAPAAPANVITAMISISLFLGRHQLAAIMILCFTGLLRCREALSLRKGDVLLSKASVILCLGVTNSGTEQKVIIGDVLAMSIIVSYIQHSPPAMDDFIFTISYGAVLSGVRRLGFFLGSLLHAAVYSQLEEVGSLRACPFGGKLC